VGSVLLRDEASAAESSQVIINMDGTERYSQQLQLINEQVCLARILNWVFTVIWIISIGQFQNLQGSTNT